MVTLLNPKLSRQMATVHDFVGLSQRPIFDKIKLPCCVSTRQACLNCGLEPKARRVVATGSATAQLSDEVTMAFSVRVRRVKRRDYI